MKKILFLFTLLFFIAGCGGIEDLISELDELDYEEEYECYHGDAILPPGTYPEYLVTPEGYEWRCEGGGAHSLRLYPDGTYSGFLQSQAFSELLEYWHDCGNHPGGLELTGEWIVDETNRFCVKTYNVQPGIYNCQEFTYESGIFTGSNYADYYEDGDYLGREYAEDDRLGTCTLVEE